MRSKLNYVLLWVKKNFGEKFIRNFSLLSISAAFNQLLPIFSFSMIAAALDTSAFADWLLVSAILQTSIVVGIFSSDILGVSLVARCADNKIMLKAENSKILSVKVALLAFIIAIYILVYVFFQTAAPYLELIFYAGGYLTAQIFFPTYYFKGTQHSESLLAYMLSSRLLYILGIFYLIDGPEDLIVLPIIMSISSVVPFIAVMCHAFLSGFEIGPPGRSGVVESFKAGLPICLGATASSYHGSMPIYVLKAFGDEASIALFGAAQKLALALIQIGKQINAALMPVYARSSIVGNSNHDYLSIKPALVFILITALLLVTLGGTISEVAINVILGVDFSGSVGLFNVLLLSTPVVLIGGFFAESVSINRGYYFKYFLVHSIAALICTPIVYGVVCLFGVYGAVLGVLVTEAAVLGGFLFCYVKFIR